jgi:hypothetical protein
MDKKRVTVLALILLLLLPCVLAAEPALTAAQQISVQQFILVVQKQNEQLKKDIIANEDENMKQFDARMVGMLAGFLRKLVVGLLGGMMVVLIGYAAIINYITNKFTPTAQRNLFRNKMAAAIGQGRVIPQGAVVQVQSPIVSQKEGQPDNLKSKPAPLSTYKVSDEPDFSGFNFSSSESQQTAEPLAPQYVEVNVKRSGAKKALIVALIFAFIIAAYLSVRYYFAHMGVPIPSLGNLTGGI